MSKEKATHTPACVGFIVDGNRRWAKARRLPAFEGHRRGYEKLKETLSWAKDAGVASVIVYALSTENWQRTEEEISYLLDLFRTLLRDEIEEITKEDVRIIFAGDLSRFPDDIKMLMHGAMERTKDKRPYTLVVAASYGGRAEILHAVQSLVKRGEQEVTEAMFSEALWTASIPDPDLVIRTGGETRLSNFLPWQSVYSELHFSKTHWPDFSRAEFDRILKEYAGKERRRGK